VNPTAVVLAAALSAGCAPPVVAHAPARNVVDARAIAEHDRSGEPPQTATSVYRGILARSWGSHCRMLPTDSVYFDRQVARCGAAVGAVAGVARLLLEVEATPEVLPPVPASDRLHWLAGPGLDTCSSR
jgi:putative component of membrane protein insertase Oxa1/YidC/SpoIIIJ protein YidD